MATELAYLTWNEPFELGLGGELEEGPHCQIQGLCGFRQVTLLL